MTYRVETYTGTHWRRVGALYETRSEAWAAEAVYLRERPDAGTRVARTPYQPSDRERDEEQAYCRETDTGPVGWDGNGGWTW